MISSAARPYIQASVPVLQAHGLAITTTFYRNMFNAHPELKNLFNMGNQANGSQQQSLAAAVFAYAANIDNVNVLQPVIARIVQKHASLGITPAHYPIVGRYLLGAIAEVLGEGATLALMAAWDEAYWLLAGELIAAEARLYQQTGYAADTWINTTVTKVDAQAEGVIAIELAPAAAVFPEFKPGQYISVAVDIDEFGYRQIRQYSLSDAYEANRYRITVKQEASGASTPQGLVSNWLHQYAQVGKPMKISHPYGDFTPELNAEHPLVLVSAGVGITPMLAILNTLNRLKSTRPVRFIHAAKSLQHVAHLDELIANARQMPDMKMALYLQENSGSVVEFPVHAGRMQLKEHALERLSNAEYYLCGPVAFMTEQWKTLISMGVSAHSIHREVFGPESLNHINA